uniref:Leucine zipper protein 1 n=1 Tax=Lygus hesperus TaxID=30085 RepID=A0A0A9Y4Q2_LYGHE
MQFFVQINPSQQEVCEVLSHPNFYLGPHESTTVALLVKNFSLSDSPPPPPPLSMYEKSSNKASLDQNGCIDESNGNHDDAIEPYRTEVIKACVYNSRKETVRAIVISSTIGPALIDRRYEIYGAAGSTVTKRVLSRVFSASVFPCRSGQDELLHKLHALCAFVQVSHAEFTSASSHAMLDPLTQDAVTA